jgi:hypothetical protein
MVSRLTALAMAVGTLVFAASRATAQETSFDDARTLYSKEVTGGIMIHSDGWGLNFTHAKYRTARNRRMLGLEIVSMKHPKEVKSFNPYYEDARGYFYGKLNYMLAIRPTYGWKYQISDKVRRSGVEVNWFWAIGPSIAMVKPVYLEIGTTQVPYEDFVVERYDPANDNHDVSRIYGRASWFRGVEESYFVPGGFAKLGLNFEYASPSVTIKAIECGAAIDAYPQQIPLMAEVGDVENKQFFVTLFASLQFGKKTVR